ncbi:HisA/HisF-related TIM barrel protein [Candidatus Carsonella ruddii]|uniref:HisA/HisF-related TIM barrel protein n=1 Tax=Carsonella ruddii TaxID=114186 RepID=A0AAJ6FQB9_CARRU|nr:HisA/HisF-related TIM barrel protein [Candidatus Carsonella ruddii]WGS66932.1 HisA/HisF-related TIM barrel protein [Candidatus Carsonella ruddii]WGS67124.1 HisA/HisF-related TIM barrel protein [Candidatus Carsonella ruddii]WGS67316.1 HisA/HisF-related TIM barrel protein [Candidatus Carsonella ruddii]WMC18334.1 MAG: HisA/HisF-related TIM barrel protein [Candidatus Carsonella ruddii]WMC18528.1 MAG: HisA/HisF-related TIM barrel protein [Candidatus Carsonella ruddii]
MLRIISCLDIKNNFVVKGINFKNLKKINLPFDLCKKYKNNGIDEIVLLDITSNYTKKSLSYSSIKKISKIINIPISIGGGIKNILKIKKMFKVGADRIILNSICYENITIIKKISNYFGSQSLIIAIDIKKNYKNENIFTYKNSGYINTNFFYLDWIIIVKKMGCGEVLITSINNDGCKLGYDINSLFFIKKKINISIIASGGIGSINDIFFLYKYCNINSFLIASLFHFNFIKPSYFKNIKFL